MTTDEQFEQFWKAYPHKVAKLAARRAFDKAIKIASLEEIISGVERYIKAKPEHIDYCHPGTFLNAGRWMDEPAAPATPKLSAGMSAQIKRDRIIELNEQIKYLEGQRPLNGMQTLRFGQLKRERAKISEDLRRFL